MKVRLAMQAKEYISVSAENSMLQDAYQDLFRSKLEQRDVTSPSQLDDEQLSEFFREVSADWKIQKAQMYKEGKISKEQL